MTYYDSFDCKINCEEFWSDEVWTEEDQRAWEIEQERLKNSGDYSPVDEGETFEGIAI